MFTMPGLDINVTAPPILFSECQLRVLAIGGGGEADGGGGGGSGYIQFYSETLTADTFISLTVGDQKASSIVTVNGQAVTAAPGNDGNDSGKGGDGYSGGGGYDHDSGSGCDGGTDGSDGEDCFYGDGGHGTRDNVTAYKMDNFVLTPGAGGNYDYTGWDYGGGGGGGVLVNGEGPQQDSLYQGWGYGGGGGYHRYRVSGVTYRYGLPGVILMEVEEN